jgi:muramoyltetrapeptide carboxypeptidase LdcA involved in peptidoglycan recycling
MSNFSLDINKKIGIVSPSWNGPGKFEHVFEKGIKQVKEIFNKDVIYSKNCICKVRPSYIDRADDINKMFADPSVDFIIASIGGSDCINVLPFLDVDLIVKNSKQKIFMGFSDTTNLLVFLDSLGVQCLHGPSIMAGFAEPSGISTELGVHIRDLFSKKFPYKYNDFSITTDIDPNWNDKDIFKGEETKYFPYPGWSTIQHGKTEGYLWGGNLETLNNLFDSKFFPFNHQKWDQTILFLETSEEKPGIEIILTFLKKLNDKGILKKIRGLVFGQFPYYSDNERVEIQNSIKKYLTEDIKVDYVTIMNLCFGHARPQWVLPLNCYYSLDTKSKEFILVHL